MVRALFDFNDVGVIEHFETMTSRWQENNIARMKFPGTSVLLVCAIQVETGSAFPNKENFLGGMDCSFERVVHMSIDNVPSWPAEYPQLMDTFIPGNKVDSGLVERGANYERKHGSAVTVDDTLDSRRVIHHRPTIFVITVVPS